MTEAVLAQPPVSRTEEGPAPAHFNWRVGLLYGFGLVLLLLVQQALYGTDFVGGDNDDVMRLVEVRDLAAGQGWYDMMQYRLGMAGGVLMHWSRFVDLPIFLLVKFFGLFIAPPLAEAMAVMVWPPLVSVPLLLMLGLGGHRLGGVVTGHIAMILGVLFVMGSNRFGAGSIDHHNVQMVLAAAMAALLLDPAHGAVNYALAGLAAALAIAVGAETVPYVAAVSLAVTALWLVEGSEARSAAMAYGLTLAAGVLAAFVATVPPARYGDVTCDNLSLGFLALALAGGGLLAAAAWSQSAHSLQRRALAVAGVGAGVFGVALAVAPQCLSSPLKGLDPLLVSLWLSKVSEARSFVAQAGHDPASLPSLYAVGLYAILVCAWMIRRGQQRRAHTILLGLIGVSFLIALVQIRGAVFANLIAILPLAGFIGYWRQRMYADRSNVKVQLVFALAALAAAPQAWALGTMGLKEGYGALTGNAAESAAKAEEGCVAKEDFAGLAVLAPSTVMAPADSGAHILRFTGHRVLSGPYHRNQAGMLAELRTGLASPAAAEAVMRASGASLLAFCAGEAQTRLVSREAPAGLYAQLYTGVVPDWLEPLPAADSTRLKIYRLRPLAP